MRYKNWEIQLKHLTASSQQTDSCCLGRLIIASNAEAKAIWKSTSFFNGTFFAVTPSRPK